MTANNMVNNRANLNQLISEPAKSTLEEVLRREVLRLKRDVEQLRKLIVELQTR